MSIERAKEWLAKELDARPGMVWTPMPICERLLCAWEAVDLMESLHPSQVRVEGLVSRQRWLRRDTLAFLLREAEAGRFEHWGTDEIVAFWNGVPYIIDGHHRFAVRHLAGLNAIDERAVNCRVVFLNPDGTLPLKVDSPPR